MTEAPVSIRPARRDDPPGISRLHRLGEIEGLTIGQRADTTAEIEEKLGSWFAVAERERRLVGLVSGRPSSLADGEWAVLPDGGRVPAGAAPSGIGGRLRHLLASARAAGITHAGLYTSSQPWPKIVAFSRSSGLEVWYVQLFGAIAAA